MIRLLPLITALLILSSLSPAFSQTPSQEGRSIESFLNPDGTINTRSGYSGSLDMRGWKLSTGSDGRPRFLRASAADTTYQNVPGDEGWDDRFGPPGTSGMVNAIAVRGEEVYVGGRFLTVGNVVAYNIACWNTRTETWSILGSAASNGVGGVVYALAIDGDDLYVGGTFQNAGSTPALGIARWNRATNKWSALAEGVQRGWWGVYRGGDVFALAIKGDSLYVGGHFENGRGGVAGGAVDSALMVWHLRVRRWFTMGRLTGTMPAYIRALVVHGDDLYAGGYFKTIGGRAINNIARFDTRIGTWNPLGSGFIDTVHALAFDSSGNLYAGGLFTAAGGVPAQNIARWDGTRWYPVGGTINGEVNALVVSPNGVLYAGGKFTTVGGTIVNGAARWDGAAWSRLASGVGVSRNATSRFREPNRNYSRGNPEIIYWEYEIRTTREPQVGALAIAGGELYGGGVFSTAGTMTSHNIARWNDTLWRPVVKVPAEERPINGVNGSVYATALVGDDLYVGGDFTRAGDVPARGIARWNNTTGTWSALGAGIAGASPFVRAIAVHGSDIIVGGIFTTAGGRPANGIARWDGVAWSPLGSGMGGKTPYVFALLSRNDGLYAAGAFTTAGGVSAERIARWDGSTWNTLGEGIRGEGLEYAYITSLAADPSGIYAAGEFTRAGSVAAQRIARWDGSEWEPLGDGLDGLVSALAIKDTTLYAGGDFSHAGTRSASHLAVWNGTAWSPVGAGADASVRSLAILPDGALYAGGEFSLAGGITANHLARWNGTAWSRIGVDTANGTNGVVNAITGGNGSLFVGGTFSVASGIGAQNIAEYDRRGFSALGSDPAGGLYGTVVTVALNGSDLYIGGIFDAVGGLRTSGIAKWDGRKWTRLGKGVDSTVRTIAFGSNGDAYVGGEFRRAGDDSTATGIARWDGSRWHPLGAGTDGFVYSIAIDGNDLYAAGNFRSAGGLVSNHIAKWDIASGVWSPLGSGIAGASGTTWIAALAARNGRVYAGGRFITAGGVASNGIAEWNGSAWSALKGGVSRGQDHSEVLALALDSLGALYVGGHFGMAGDIPARHIAKWSDTAWSALGNGVYGNEGQAGEIPAGGVYALASGRGGLYAGGQFVIADIVQANGIARWDGTIWSTLGSGVVSDFNLARVTSIALDRNGDVHTGGSFTIAGGRPSYYFGIWHPPASVGVPVVKDPSTASLVRSWPNPLGESTTLEIDLPVAGSVSLVISSIDGHEVARLADGEYGAGPQRFVWDAGEYPAGVYLYTLRMGERVESGRLVVVR
jgi:hypothetical protein